MGRDDQTGSMKQAGFSLSQETITVLTVGVALAGLILVNQGEMRAEARADRARTEAAMNLMRAEARADRARTEAAMNLMRVEARADREAFAKQITRIVEQQGTLSGLVDGLRNPIPPSEG